MQQLLKDLSEVYDNNMHEIGKVYRTRYDTDYTLLPIYHILNKSHIEVHLNEKGELIRTKVKAKMIPMPVTEDSLVRSSSVTPHFLHDKLIYLCKDLHLYTENEKLKQQTENVAYMNQLSKFEHPIMKAVYAYLSNNSLIQDLLDTEVLFLNEEGKFLQNSNGSPIYRIVDSCIENLFVRFHVETSSPYYLWEDRDFFEELIEEIKEKDMYQREKSFGFCYVDGSQTRLANRFPYKIRHVGDISKLITNKKNDKIYPYNDDFMMRDIQNKSIGLETSFKAHNALSWLIAKQGIELNGMIYLLWSNQKKEELVIESGFDFLDDYVPTEDEDLASLTNETLSKRILNQALGLTADIDTQEDIMFLTLDAFDRTKGALAVLDYQRFEAKKFLEKIQLWSNHAQYYMHFYDENTHSYKTLYKSPSIFEILKVLKVQKNFYKMIYRMLMPTFIEGKPIPQFVIKTLREKLMKHRIATIHEWNDIARCYFSCIKFNQFVKGEPLDIHLDESNEDADYLAGRLFAYMTYAEDVLANKKFQKYNPALKYQNLFIYNTEKLKHHTYIKNVCMRGKARRVLSAEDLTVIKSLLDKTEGSHQSAQFYIGYLQQYDKLKGVQQENVEQ